MLFLSVVAGLLSTLSTHAVNDSLLTDVYVTAPKFPEKLSRTGKVASIISKEQIQASLGKNLGELLQEAVGIAVVGARSAPGANQEVYVRGSNTGNVLVLIDGFPVNDPSHIASVLDWNLINLASIERIEILKGGQSTLYGSDAMAAVINLVTNKRSDNQSLTLQGGGFGTYSQQLQVQKKLGQFKIGLQAQNFGTQGYSAAQGTVEKDGFRQQSLGLHVGSKLGKRGYVDLNYQGQSYQGNLDGGPFIDDTDYTSQSSSHSFRVQYQLNLNHADLYVRAFQDIIHRNFRNDSTNIPANAYSSFNESTYAGLNQGAEVYAQLRLPHGIVGVLGTEFRQQATDQMDFSISTYGRYDSPQLSANLAKVQTWGTYLTLQKQWANGIGAEFGGRYTRQSTYGDFTTFNLNPFWQITAQTKVFTNYYSSFKIPSLYQLYSPYGNKSLKPERGTTFEVGAQQAFGRMTSRVVAFQHDVQDGIIFQSIAVDPFGKYENVAIQKTSGVEAEIGIVLKKFDANFSYTYLDGSMKRAFAGKDSTYSSLIRRPAHQWTLRLSQQIHPRLRASLMTQFVGARTDYFFDDETYATKPVVLANYVWSELQLSYKMTQALTWNVLVKNLLNQEITEIYGYAGQKRNVQISLIWRF